MGKDSKQKDSSKGKGKQVASGSDENASKGKGKGGKAADGLGTCTYVKGFIFHIIYASILIISNVLYSIVSRHLYFGVNFSLNLFQQGISFVRSKERSMKHTRSSKMVGLAMEIRSHQLSLQR